MNKKGDLTTTQIVTIAFAIAGFAVAAGFIYYLNYGQQSDQEICHLSALTRATASSAIQGSIPLKCTTGKICITDGSGGCEDSFAGEKEITVIKLKGTENEKISTIEEISANAMFDCWNIMGQGKLDLYGSYWQNLGLETNEGSTCVVCSRLALDKSISSELLAKVNVKKYMQSNLVPGSSLTYLQTFTDNEVSAYSSVDKYSYKPTENINVGPSRTTRTEDEQVAFLFMQIKAGNIGDSLKNLATDGAILLAGGTFAASTVPGGSTLLFRLAAPAARIGLFAVPGVAGFSALNTYSSQLLAAGYCGAYTTNDENAKNGCSLVQAVPYTVGNINSLCDNIQGNP